MQIQMYSLKPFDISLRKGLSLAGDPYLDSPQGKATRDYLMGLGVFFYRDEKNSPNGLLLQPNDGDPSPITDRNGFDAYKVTVELVETKNKPPKIIWPGVPATWKKPTPAVIEKNGDPLAWLHWNHKVHVLSISDTGVLCDRAG